MFTFSYSDIYLWGLHQAIHTFGGLGWASNELCPFSPKKKQWTLSTETNPNALGSCRATGSSFSGQTRIENRHVLAADPIPKRLKHSMRHTLRGYCFHSSNCIACIQPYRKANFANSCTYDQPQITVWPPVWLHACASTTFYTWWHAHNFQFCT
jgi:hypothetical protein